jgi:HlyD family secretion protein
VYIQTASKHDVLTIPAEFLARQAGDAGVFVAEDQTARWRVVQLGLRGAENVEVIDGLSDSDQVLRTTKGTTPLTDGQAIKMP